MDNEGFLKVTGRIKELIITEGGKNIAPVPIEETIKSQLPKIISNVMVVGDAKKYLSCLITLQVVVDMKTMQPTSVLESWAQAWCKKIAGAEVKTVDDFLTGPHSAKLRNQIQGAIDEYNTKAETSAHRIQKFTVMPGEFSFVGGELGPTLKMKRHVITAKYSDDIDNMYL